MNGEWELNSDKTLVFHDEIYIMSDLIDILNLLAHLRNYLRSLLEKWWTSVKINSFDVIFIFGRIWILQSFCTDKNNNCFDVFYTKPVNRFLILPNWNTLKTNRQEIRTLLDKFVYHWFWNMYSWLDAPKFLKIYKIS